MLLFVGRVDPEKNLDEVLRAVAQAVTKVDFHFVIVGKGIRKSALEKLAAELNITEQVTFTGYVPEEELPGFYQLSHCFIIASIAELLSLATLQAMASGLPVIAADICALSELVQSGINGYLFKSGDTDAICDSICHIMTRDDLYHEMSAMSLEYSSKHDIQKTVDLFEALYKTIVENSVILSVRKLQQPAMKLNF